MGDRIKWNFTVVDEMIPVSKNNIWNCLEAYNMKNPVTDPKRAAQLIRPHFENL